MTSWAALAAKAPVKAANVETNPEDKPRVAVIDANAIIHGAGLLNLMKTTDKVVTIPEVLREIRDKQSRSTLATLPFTIHTQEPNEESIQAVVKFARATGDLHALSSVDTRLLALARTIEVSYYGSDHLRDLPAPPKVQKKRAIDSKTLPGWGSEGGDWAELDKINEEEEAAAEAALSTSTSRIASRVQQLDINDDNDNDSNTSAMMTSIINDTGDAGVDDDEEMDDDNDDDDDDDDDDGWETAKKTKNKTRRARRRAYRQAEQLEYMQQQDDNNDDDTWSDTNDDDTTHNNDDNNDDNTITTTTTHHHIDSAVCSVTADFPMQNVLLQMGLRLVAPDGRQLTNVSRWVLRCTACNQVTKEVGRVFCPRCGNATLERVQVKVDADGAEQYGVKKKHVLRGTKFSIPKPKGGRAPDAILREDQLLTKKHLLRAKKAAQNSTAGESLDPFAPEYTDETWHQAAVLQKSGVSGATLLMTGWKKNPNERKHIATNRRRK